MSGNGKTRVRLCVLAKYPAPGRAKTRLIPALGEAGAAAVASALLQHTLQLCATVGELPDGAGLNTELRLTPSPADPCWQTVPQLAGFSSVAQGEGNLGERMQRAVNSEPVVLIGADCPSLQPGDVQWAAACLHEGVAVMIPALDGGYVLLGLPGPVPGIFDGIAWSTASVAEQTRARLRAAGMTWRERPALADLDVITDVPLQPAAFLRRCEVLRRYGEAADG